ncbi:MAG: hypothetical protein ACI88A_002843 [Paraglaciecola sp.]
MLAFAALPSKMPVAQLLNWSQVKAIIPSLTRILLMVASVPLYLIISKRHANAPESIDRFNHAFAELSSSEKKQIDLQFTELLSAK